MSKYDEKNVPNDYIADNSAIGGGGGTPFTFIKLDGARLKKIRAWSTTWCIRGVKVWMTDGSEYLAGVSEGEHIAEFLFEEGEIITKLKLLGASQDRLGAIWFQTNKNKEWRTTSNEATYYFQEVGSGICCGIFGASGVYVDRLGFAMLREIKAVVITNVKYPNLATKLVSTKPDTIAHQQFDNGLSIEETFELSAKRAVIITREWSISATLTFGMSVEVSSGIPEVASVKGKTEWSLSPTANYPQSSTKTEEKFWSWTLKCPPYRRMLGQAVMYADDISTEYEADLKVCFVNDKVMQYKVQGMYKGLNERSGVVTLEDLGPCKSGGGTAYFISKL